MLINQTHFFHLIQVSAKKTKALLSRGGEIGRKAVQGVDLNSSNKGKGKDKDKGKETLPESLRVLTPTNLASPGSEPREPESGAKEVERKAGVNGKGKKKVAGDEEKNEGNPAKVVDVDISKGSTKADSPGDEKKGDVGQGTKKPGGTVDLFDNVTATVTTDDTTKPVVDNVRVTPPAATSDKGNGPEVPPVVVDVALSLDTTTTTTEKKQDAAKEKANPTTNEKKVELTVDEKMAKPKEGVESSKQGVEPDGGDAATPKRVTKELPASPAKSPKERLVPVLGLTVPEPPRNGSAPLSATTATGPGLSPLQKALEDAEDETLMERMARLKIGDAGYKPPKDTAPPAHTDLESDFDCETALSGPPTPRSRAGRGSFSLVLRSDVPLSDDDDLFLDCSSNASVSNLDGI
ncbi:hypothetical protein BDM02DRAFT_581767 [Thelephora ganbajun]|uniref:Uncharacterized protein n=1 Tax=Thelephora ganbajun TaxID=370292 RepID=A0ACB6Z6M7_THEGA|nr:hypothetical protein BDM02DRAFT_581767 [Thelephora ganbajun]